MRRYLALTAILLGLAVPAARAATAPSDPCTIGYFDTDQLTDTQRRWLVDSLHHTFFPCERLEPKLMAHPDTDQIVVLVRELNGPRGSNTEGVRIDIDDDVSEKDFAEVFLHELGHSIDALYLEDLDREAVMETFQTNCWNRCRYENRALEAFADASVRAFSDLDASAEQCVRTCNHPMFPTWKRVDRIAQIVML